MKQDRFYGHMILRKCGIEYLKDYFIMKQFIKVLLEWKLYYDETHINIPIITVFWQSADRLCKPQT